MTAATGSGHARADRLDHGLGVRKTTPEQAREESRAIPGGNDLTVDEHVELRQLPVRELHVDAELVLERSGETRRPGAVASSGAVDDLDVHGVESIGHAEIMLQ